MTELSFEVRITRKKGNPVLRTTLVAAGLAVSLLGLTAGAAYADNLRD
ncbi:MAG: hypothetical protein Kilf2KO_15100 [Rhodospirillales bacterium]